MLLNIKLFIFLKKSIYYSWSPTISLSPSPIYYFFTGFINNKIPKGPSDVIYGPLFIFPQPSTAATPNSDLLTWLIPPWPLCHLPMREHLLLANSQCKYCWYSKKSFLAVFPTPSCLRIHILLLLIHCSNFYIILHILWEKQCFHSLYISEAQHNIRYIEKEMATHSSILAWRIPWTEESGRLQSTELPHNWVTNTFSIYFFSGYSRDDPYVVDNFMPLIKS